MSFFRFLAVVLLVGVLWSPAPIWAQEIVDVSSSSSDDPVPSPVASTRSHKLLLTSSVLLVEAIDDQGNVIPFGQKHFYPHVLAPASMRLRLKNTGIDRALVLLSLNGVNPLTGEKATRASKGILIAGGQEVVVHTGRLTKKASEGPLMLGHAQEGHVALGVYVERIDYPTITPEMETVPPFGPENYVYDQKGVKHWIPPTNFPFRKRHQDPSSSVYFTYEAQK